MKYVVDSYSWIDYFEGNEAGEKVKKYVENPDNEIITNILTISEISSFFERKNKDFEESYKILISISKIFNFDIEFAKEAGALYVKLRRKIKNFGLVDTFIFLTAEKVNAKIITGDEHFRSFKESVLIK